MSLMKTVDIAYNNTRLAIRIFVNLKNYILKSICTWEGSFLYFLLLQYQILCLMHCFIIVYSSTCSPTLLDGTNVRLNWNIESDLNVFEV
jgi:hypothetical protein